MRSWPTVLAVVVAFLLGALLGLPSSNPTPAASPAAAGELAFGAFPGPGTGDGTDAVTALEGQLGRRLDIVHWFKHWGLDGGTWANSEARVRAAAADGRTPLITWEPWDPAGSTTTQPAFSLASIAAGAHDAYIDSWAQGLAGLGTPVYLRYGHEMNSDWYPWSAVNNGNTAQLYVQAWRHLHDRFAAAGATNVLLVWAPNNVDKPADNPLEAYWPGADVVDVLGIDAYNCYRGWQSPDELLGAAYERVTALDPTKPVWLTETASCEPSGDVPGSAGKSKGQWISELFTSADRYPQLAAIVWFNEDKRHDWRVNSSEGALAALREALAAPS